MCHSFVELMGHGLRGGAWATGPPTSTDNNIPWPYWLNRASLARRQEAKVVYCEVRTLIVRSAKETKQTHHHHQAGQLGTLLRSTRDFCSSTSISICSGINISINIGISIDIRIHISISINKGSGGNSCQPGVPHAPRRVLLLVQCMVLVLVRPYY